MSGLRILQCQHCSAAFRRRYSNPKGKTGCPVCRKKTSRIVATDQNVIQPLLTKEYEKKKAKVAGNMNIGAVLAMKAIKADQIPNSLHEGIFKSRCAEKGWSAHRPSWPDFIVETQDGFIAVEVKGPNDAISSTQEATFDLLERMGVPVYIWKNTAEGSGSLSRWKHLSVRRNGRIAA